MSTGEEKGPKTAGKSFIEGDIHKTPEDIGIIEARGKLKFEYPVRKRIMLRAEGERDYTVSDAFDSRASGKYVIFEKDGTFQKYFLDLFNKSFSPKHEELISGQGEKKLKGHRN